MKAGDTRGDTALRSRKVRGAYLRYYDKRRGWIIRAWPKPKGLAQSPAQQASMQRMASAAYACKRAFTWEIEWAKQATKGSQWTWRDYYMSGLYGRTIEVNFKDGTTWRSFAIMSQEIQLLLDALGVAPGSIIYRAIDGWRALSPGDATTGTVLTYNGTDQVPTWLAPPTANPIAPAKPNASVPDYKIDWHGNFTSIAVNFLRLKGIFIPQGQQIKGTLVPVSVSGGGTVAAHLTPVLYDALQVNSNAPKNLLASGATKTPISDGFASLPFTTAYTAIVDTRAWIGYIHTGAAFNAINDSDGNMYFKGTSSDVPENPLVTPSWGNGQRGFWSF